MWETPIYKFRKKVYIDIAKSKRDYLTIDVTGSAPPMKDPGDQLKSVFEELTKNKLPRNTKILDVGAAKLRNTLYLLENKFNVYAVEYPELAKKMPQAQVNWKKAAKYPNFKKLIFPRDFYSLKKEAMDIILLINVVNVMPIPDERLMLLSLCREKIKKKGILLWYNWRAKSMNPTEYTEKNKLNDGYFKGVGRRYKTFYGEWNKSHVLEMLNATGFSLNTKVRLDNVGTNQAYAFNPNRPKLIKHYLQQSPSAKRRTAKTILSEAGDADFLQIYTKELKSIKRGKEGGREGATKFHHISSRLLANLFDHQLKNLEVEKEVLSGLMRIDIKFQNRNRPGFLKDILELRDIKCPSVMVECKNYADDVGNPEFDQLSGRLKPQRGMFGILVCRKINNKENTLRRCMSKFSKNEYIIVLEDKDIENLVRLKVHDGNEGIDDYVYKKIEEIVDLM